MNILLLTTILLGNMQVTAYRSVPEQTRPEGYDWTASGEKCHVRGVAVSQDLLKKNGGQLKFGDLIFIDGIGFKFVTDVMNKRHKQRIDVWTDTFENEKKFDKQFRGKKLRIWLVKA